MVDKDDHWRPLNPMVAWSHNHQKTIGQWLGKQQDFVRRKGNLGETKNSRQSLLSSSLIPVVPISMVAPTIPFKCDGALESHQIFAIVAKI